MSNTLASLRNKIGAAEDLRSVVRTMKSVAAANIGQYQKSVIALNDYNRSVELGLSVCFRSLNAKSLSANHDLKTSQPNISAIIFGSDQVLVGQFNDIVSDYAIKALAKHPVKPKIWAVGTRVHARMISRGVNPAGQFPLPESIQSISPLIGKILIEVLQVQGENTALYLFYNKPKSASGYEPTHIQLLPLNQKWRERLTALRWPSVILPEVIGDPTETLSALIREYLFVSLFRAAAESLASENASRLAAMQRADKNIDELLDNLNRNFHRFRQNSIDEELFDVISGYDALTSNKKAVG
jgi:F-type H+-transporting ATPase subunit gamma